MIKRWIMKIFILIIIASILIWGSAEWSIAKEERFYFYKIFKILDRMIANQEKILEEIEALKEEKKVPKETFSQ